MKVFVYFNLHKKVWSVKALEGRNKGRVIAHADKVLLRDVTFKVSEAGRQRVIREGRKNVHAGAVGTLEAFTGELKNNMPWWHQVWGSEDHAYAKYARNHGVQVSYNPYLCGSFFHRVNDKAIPNPVSSAPMVFMGKKVVFTFDPCNMEETV